MSFHSKSDDKKKQPLAPQGSSKSVQSKSRGQTKDVNKTTLPSIVNDALESPGQPLSNDTSELMESRFNYDFSKVRLHTDTQANQSAQALKARAYTIQNDIVFGRGQYQPTTTEGKRLMAHELTHVVQQNCSATEPAEQGKISSATDMEEETAHRFAEEAIAKNPEYNIPEAQLALSQSSPSQIQRQEIADPPDLTLRYSPSTAAVMGSETLSSFAINSPALTSTHRNQLTELAATILNLLEQYPGGIVSIVGHADATGSEPHNMRLGQQRAESVRDALIDAGVPADVITTDSAGEESLRVQTQRAEGLNRRVEISFRPEPSIQLNIPPLSLQSPTAPDPEEAQPDLELRIPPPRPETPEERIDRIIRTPPPAPPQRRSFNDLFWQSVDDGLDSIMNKFKVPDELRGLVRQGAHAAIERGAQAILDQALDSAGIQGEAREAIRQAVRAMERTPMIR